MLNLTLHCGARSVPREELDGAPTPRGTDTWTPIPHPLLLGLVQDSLTGSGLTVRNQAHALSADRLRYFGLLEVTNGQTHPDYGLVLGLRNSHDKSFPAALVLGAGVFVCDNLAFSGEVTIARRHTRFIQRDLPHLVHKAVGRLADLRGLQDRRISEYKQLPLSDPQAHDLIVRALDARVFPAAAIPTVVREWRRPGHEAFAKCGKTAWRLFNAVTEAVKGRSLDALPRRTQVLHGLMDAACGLLL